MPTFKYKVFREYLHVQQHFHGIALGWRDLPQNFFKALYSSLGTRLNIQTSELSGNAGNRLSEMYARYNIYGGPSTVSLFADRVAFEFPNITSADLALIYEIMGTVHDFIPTSFPELRLAHVEVQDFCHFDLGTQEQVGTFFQRFQFQPLCDAFGDLPSQFTFGPKFEIASEDGRFRCKVFVEPSSVSSTAIFGSIITTLSMPAPANFPEKTEIIEGLTRRCLSGLGLEIDGAA